MTETAQSPAEGWLERHGDALYAFALRRLCDPVTAEDLVQETLLAAWRSRAAFRSESTERTWLIGILKHKCIDEIRRQQRAAVVDAMGDDDVESQVFRTNGRWREPPLAWGGDLLRQLENDAFMNAVGHCLDNVPAAQRASFVMRELYDQDITVTSERLGVSQNNLYVLLHRARLRLRRCLEKSGFVVEKRQ
ncbi:MAG: sigma-70 family RNA polymerase sigma factor [Salinisphaera sp.]|jgi:RNA polymerase sigma-70 factor (TIGR02943 family)|nr:sigma-70 family RNA polymerase sigma factor [Salinisphaera sp.]